MTTVMSVAASPTMIEILDPQIVSARTERPRSSVPSGYCQEGGDRIGPDAHVGDSSHRLAKRGAKIATRTKKTKIPSPAIPILLFRYCRQVRRAASFLRVLAIAFALFGIGSRCWSFDRGLHLTPPSLWDPDTSRGDRRRGSQRSPTH